MHKSLLIITMTFIMSSALAAGKTPGNQEGEFFIDEIEGKKGGPNSFIMQHAARQSWPAAVDNAFRAEAGARAARSFDGIRFRGLSKGRQGVWQTVGPVTESDNVEFTPKNSSGRVTDVETGASCNDDKCRLYVGTAGGGLWRTDRALHTDNPRWEHLANGLLSNSIGSLTIDPNDATAQTLYAGTGEANFNYTSAAGRGLFKSTNGGDSFIQVPTMILDTDVSASPIDFTATRGISQVAIKPGEPNTIYVSTTTAMMGMTAVRGGQSTITGGPQAKVGLYKTTDGGANWVLLFEAPIKTDSSPGTPEGLYETLSGVKDVQLDPQDADTVYISVADDGLYRSSPALDGNAGFHKVFLIATRYEERYDSYAAFDMTVKDGKTRIYLYNGNGYWRDFQALYRLDDSRVTHDQLFTAGANTAAWQDKTQPFTQPGDYVDWIACGSQCVYDLVVATPDGRPDTVYVGGQLTAYLGDPTIRSTNGGESFYSYGVDLAEQAGYPHVDVRAIAFNPENPDIVFVGSDGGMVRSNGTYGNGQHRCVEWGWDQWAPFYVELCDQALAEVPGEFIFMNRGLQAMQLFNVSADPNRPTKRIMAGTQDNSTQWHDGTKGAKNWSKIFGYGDGTSANGFHAEDPNILFASFQSNYFFVHFDAGNGGRNSWLHTSGPIRFSGELSDPVGPSGRQFITFDPMDADTQFTGFESVWRTRNNGGDRAFLEANCRLDNDAWDDPQCGDWEALGTFLTRDDYGNDRAGGVIVAAERSSRNTGTLWAATSLGRLFIAANIDEDVADDVVFTRLDSTTTPPRFISGIAVDNDDPNRAFISYSGFNAVTPATPGHVFEVVYDPNTGTATFTPIDHNLGDMPINHLVRDDATGDLYAATDFGVLALPSGTTAWEIAAEGLPTVLTPHLEIHSEKRMLFAATHGMGAWYMNLGKLKRK